MTPTHHSNVLTAPSGKRTGSIAIFWYHAKPGIHDSKCPVLHPANFPGYSLLGSPSQHRAHRPLWCRGPMSCQCWEVQRYNMLFGVPRFRAIWATGWVDSRTNRTASLLLTLLGIPTSGSCWHGHLRFHKSPPRGVCKIMEGHTSTSIRTSTTHMGHWSYFIMPRCILANWSASSATFV
jgi:hypothetical protein